MNRLSLRISVLHGKQTTCLGSFQEGQRGQQGEEINTDGHTSESFLLVLRNTVHWLGTAHA